MATATAEPTAQEAAPKLNASMSLAEALDAALGTEAPTPLNREAPAKAKAPAAEPSKPVAETPVEKTSPEPAKSQDNSLKTPDSIFDRLNSLGQEKTESSPAKEEKAEAPEEKPQEEALPESTPPAAQTAFAKLTKELREAKSKLKEFESKLATRTETVENKGGDAGTDTQVKEYQQKLEQFQKERDELENELRVFKIEGTREYKSSIGEPIQKTTQTIVDIAKAYEAKPNAILEAANEPDGVKRRVLLKELTGEMDPVDALAVRTKVEELASLYSKKDELLKNSKQALEAIAKQEEEQERASRASYDAEAKKAFSEVWSSFQEDMPLLKKVDGNEAWNNTVDQLRMQAEKLDAEPLGHRQRAMLTYQAVSLPLVVQVFKDYITKTNQELTSLKSSLSEYRKATPGAGSGKPAPKTQSRDSSLSFLEALEKGL